MHAITRKLSSFIAIPPSLYSHPGRRNFVELVMKNALVIDSSFGTWPAPFSEFPSQPVTRRSGPDVTHGEWSSSVRIGVGLGVVAVLMILVGVTSLLQFGAFSRTANAPNGPRMAEVVNTSGDSPVREVPVFLTEGDSK
jgi:hypothetical protein